LSPLAPNRQSDDSNDSTDAAASAAISDVGREPLEKVTAREPPEISYSNAVS
jgi:hypothetical protein